MAGPQPHPFLAEHWASSGLTDIHHQGHGPGKDVQNGDHGTEEARTKGAPRWRVTASRDLPGAVGQGRSDRHTEPAWV